MRSALTAVLTVLALGAVAGCGSGSTPTTTLSIATGPSAPASPRGAGPPPQVPTRSEGRPADKASARVIRAWTDALARGDTRRAARFFALPSHVQNGTPVLTLKSARERLAFNLGFPCAARPTKLERAKDGFTIVEFTLLDPPGGGGCAGGVARTAIRVRDSHIVDWFSLDGVSPSAPGSPGPAPPPAPDPGGPGRIV